MPDTIIDTLTTVALNYGVPAVLVFWYACRVRHPARPRWRAFLMTLTVLAVVPPLVLGGLHCYITLRGGSVFVMVPRVAVAAVRASRDHPGLAPQHPRRPRAVGSVTVRAGIDRAGCVTRRAGAKYPCVKLTVSQPLT